MSQERIDLLAELTQFSEEVGELWTRPVTYPDGTYIVTEGQPGESMYVLMSGKVAVVCNSAAGPTTIEYLEAGECFGEMTLAEDVGVRVASVRAFGGDCEVIEFRHDDVKALSKRNPQFGNMLLWILFRILARRLHKTNGRLLTMNNLLRLNEGLLADARAHGYTPGEYKDSPAHLKGEQPT